MEVISVLRTGEMEEDKEAVHSQTLTDERRGPGRKWKERKESLLLSSFQGVSWHRYYRHL